MDAVDAAFAVACTGSEPADDADWGLAAAAATVPTSQLPQLTAQSMGVLPPHSLVTFRGMVVPPLSMALSRPHSARALIDGSLPLRLPLRRRGATQAHTSCIATDSLSQQLAADPRAVPADTFSRALHMGLPRLSERAPRQVTDMYNNEYYLGAFQSSANPGVWRTTKWREAPTLADDEEVTAQRLWERRVLLLVPVPHETDWCRAAAAANAAPVGAWAPPSPRVVTASASLRLSICDCVHTHLTYDRTRPSSARTAAAASSGASTGDGLTSRAGSWVAEVGASAGGDVSTTTATARPKRTRADEEEQGDVSMASEASDGQQMDSDDAPAAKSATLRSDVPPPPLAPLNPEHPPGSVLLKVSAAVVPAAAALEAPLGLGINVLSLWEETSACTVRRLLQAAQSS